MTMLFLGFLFNLLCVGFAAEHLVVYGNIRIPIKVPRLNDSVSRCPVRDQDVPFDARLDWRQVRFRFFGSVLNQIKRGGRWNPPSCQPVQRVAIIVPYRNRSEHLFLLAYNLHRFLVKQMVCSYRLFVVEQSNKKQFNRAKLLNVGAVEAGKSDLPYDCLIFHDVELIPMNLGNLYLCGTQPIHKSYNIRSFQRFYENLFGGVVSITAQSFHSINGFSNRFFGWGGEDDEIRTRLIRSGYKIQRLPYQISEYAKLPHKQDRMNSPNPLRFEMINDSFFKSRYDGLNSLWYRVINYQMFPLYTLITVDI